MKIARWGAAAAVAGLAAGALALASPAQAQDEVTFSDPGPVDLSGSDHATGNVGERVTLGGVELDAGEWTIAASVRLFVPDPEPAANDGRGQWKNSQGCGLYTGGEQIGGAGGSSSLWTGTADGKEVVFETFLVPPDWVADPIVVPVADGETTTVELECFIDQSHSGASLDQRDGMAATDISITAARTPDPEPTTDPTTKPTGEPELECVDVNTADAETLTLLMHVDAERAQQILELRPFTSVDDLDRVDGLAAGGPRLDELVAGGGDFLPLCKIAAGEGGEDNDEGLPVTGSSPLMIGAAGFGLLGLGGGAYLLARRRRVAFTP